MLGGWRFHRVTVKKEGKVVPTDTQFLTFKPTGHAEGNQSWILEGESRHVCPPTRCGVLTAISLATRAGVAKQQQSVNGVGKVNMKRSVMDPRYAAVALVPTLPLPKIARSGRKRRLDAFVFKNASITCRYFHSFHFYFLRLYCPNGNSLMGNSGCLLREKPAATESRYPTHGAYWVI